MRVLGAQTLVCSASPPASLSVDMHRYRSVAKMGRPRKDEEKVSTSVDTLGKRGNPTGTNQYTAKEELPANQGNSSEPRQKRERALAN